MAGDKIQATGKVIKEKGKGFFDVVISTGGDCGTNIEETNILCQISGKIRQNDIRIITGDIVDIEIDPYNLKRGIIKFRRKDNNYGK